MPLTSGLVGVNTLLPSHTGLTLTDFVGINDSGQILRDANDPRGLERVVQLSPKLRCAGFRRSSLMLAQAA